MSPRSQSLIEYPGCTLAHSCTLQPTEIEDDLATHLGEGGLESISFSLHLMHLPAVQYNISTQGCVSREADSLTGGLSSRQPPTPPQETRDLGERPKACEIRQPHAGAHVDTCAHV